MKTFVKTEGHADSYENLSVKFIGGHNPDFVLLSDEGAELERHPLNALTTQEIHDLVAAKGMVRLPQDQIDALAVERADKAAADRAAEAEQREVRVAELKAREQEAEAKARAAAQEIDAARVQHLDAAEAAAEAPPDLLKVAAEAAAAARAGGGEL